MNEAQDPFLAAAFFDAPGLIAVRFARQSGNRVASFAAYRRPDVTPAANAFTVVKVVWVGVLVSCVAFPLLRGCADNSHDTSPSQPVIDNAVTVDSSQSSAWSEGLDRLADDLAPTRADLRPWMVRTLLEVPRELTQRGSATGDWLRPRHGDRDAIAHRQGAALSEMLINAGAGNDLAVILDLSGPSSVAAAAAMAPRFDPVFTMDNLPHPNGVVPSEQTLGAAVYWRTAFTAANGARPADAPAVFLLEGDRLARYDNEVDRFDNRSRARLPDAGGFKALGVSRILYVRQHRGGVAESDDLNALFTELAAAGVVVKHLALDTLDEPIAAMTADHTQRTPTPNHTWFRNNYSWYRPTGWSWNGTPDPDARYRTSPRTTAFSLGGTSRLDGGLSHRDTAFSRLTPAPRPSGGNSGSGGSWLRSSFHTSG